MGDGDENSNRGRTAKYLREKISKEKNKIFDATSAVRVNVTNLTPARAVGSATPRRKRGF
jgi:hypothetical protein